MKSLSARRAWIEIRKRMLPVQLRFVALRKESVDRNCMEIAYTAGYSVALRKESVDRNRLSPFPHRISMGVALRKESVDRNPIVELYYINVLSSLSARRAWIEIPPCYTQ